MAYLPLFYLHRSVGTGHPIDAGCHMNVRELPVGELYSVGTGLPKRRLTDSRPFACAHLNLSFGLYGRQRSTISSETCSRVFQVSVAILAGIGNVGEPGSGMTHHARMLSPSTIN